jgi:uncharacterized protein YijF (DUF1287 family)
LQGAVAQLSDPAVYDQAYVPIKYPGGDVPKAQGACTDVVIRAIRRAGKDLQLLIHEDIQLHPDRYPRAKRPDTNIDHRRVPNQVAFFRAHGSTLPISWEGPQIATWQPGDIVVWKIGGRLDHTGIISDRKNPRGLPLVIHNIWKTAEEDVLSAWPIVWHFRYPKPD